MLTGTIASVGAPFQPMNQKITMIMCGLLAQGLGMMVSILMYSSYFRRSIQYGLPSPQSRPAMFIAVGPPAFTALAIIGLSNAWPVNETNYFGGGDGAVARQILLTLSTVSAVFIWGLSLWFFCISVIANLLVSVPFVPREKAIHFGLNWWAYVFPNVGFTIATIQIGKQLNSQGIKWVGSAMTILLIMMYLFVLVHHFLAIRNRVILWPGRDEDTYVREAMGKLDRGEGHDGQPEDAH
jgi:tellurite resistance protein TehA-like permease